MLLTANGTGGINAFRARAIAGVDSRIAGGGSMSVYNEASAPFTRRAACWAFGVTGMSALCTDQRATLVSPDIILMVTHSHPANGATCTFVSEDGNNTSEARTISAQVDLGTSLNANGGDITVGRLTTPLPASIVPVRLAVGYLRNYLPPTISSDNWNVPLMLITGARQATVNNWNSILDSGSGPSAENRLFNAIPVTSPRSDYFVAKNSSDSGRGGGVIINGEFIMLLALSLSTQGGNGWANWLYLSAIDAAITTLGGQPRASTFDPATL